MDAGTRNHGGREQAAVLCLPHPQRCLGGALMRMFVVSVIGLAGLVSLFAFCPPLRNTARAVILDQGTMALSSTTSVRPEAGGGMPVQGAEVPGSST